MSKQAAVEVILAACLEHGLALPEQQAYVLATTEHETAGTLEPINEIGSRSYFDTRYGPHTRVGKVLGNTMPGDGARFKGRGYVQITGRTNYAKFGELLNLDLVRYPEKALDPEVARFVLAYGFKHGSFTGKKLEDYVRPGKVDFIGARRCINGTDQAAKIAGLAYKWLKVLKGKQ
jgi:predicted chitinase